MYLYGPTPKNLRRETSTRPNFGSVRELVPLGISGNANQEFQVDEDAFGLYFPASGLHFIIFFPQVVDKMRLYILLMTWIFGGTVNLKSSTNTLA